MNKNDLDNVDIEKLVTDTIGFNQFVYTPLFEVMDELKERWNNKNLEKEIDKYLEKDIPKPLKNGHKAVLFRQLFTPNYEFRRFINITNALGIEPMLLEYFDDKFTSQNPLKLCLGKMHFQKNIENDDGAESRNIIDVNLNDGKKIKDIKTLWGQSFIDFHHELLRLVFPSCHKYLFDASEWFHRGGVNAKQYYIRYLFLFIRNGILLENFILEDNELKFVKEVFLPAFIKVWKLTGKKPIIVSLLPLDTQNDTFWTSHPPETLIYVHNKKIV